MCIWYVVFRRNETTFTFPCNLNKFCTRCMTLTNNGNYKAICEICLKLTTKAPERGQWHHSGVFIVNFKTDFTYCSSVTIVDFELVNAAWESVEHPHNTFIYMNIAKSCYFFNCQTFVYFLFFFSRIWQMFYEFWWLISHFHRNFLFKINQLTPDQPTTARCFLFMHLEYISKPMTFWCFQGV